MYRETSYLWRKKGTSWYGRRSNSSACYYEVVVITHPPYGFHYFGFIVGYDLDSFQLDSDGEAESREEGGISVDGLYWFEGMG